MAARPAAPLLLAALSVAVISRAHGKTAWEQMPLRLTDSVWASSELEEAPGGRRVR